MNIVQKMLQDINEVCEVMEESDPDKERFLAFKQRINDGTSIYKNWLIQERSNTTTQKNMRNFFQQRKNIK